MSHNVPVSSQKTIWINLYSKGCWTDFKSIQWVPAAILRTPCLRCWVLGCYIGDSSSLFLRCRTTTNPSSSSCLRWLYLLERIIFHSGHVSGGLLQRYKLVCCFWWPTFSSLSDLAGPSTVANGTHAFTPAACWRGQREFLRAHHYLQHFSMNTIIIRYHI